MYKLLLATRYLVKRRITYLAIGVVALSAFMVIVVMTVLQGLVEDFKQRTRNYVGDCVVATDSLVGFPYYQEFIKVLDQSPLVEATSPLISTYGLVADVANRQHAAGLKIIGVDPVLHGRVTRFGQALHFHRDHADQGFEPVSDPNDPGCILGIGLVLDRDSRGEYNYAWAPTEKRYEITCFPLTARGAPAKAGAGEVSAKRFAFSDVAHTGLPREDDGVVYVAFGQLQVLCGMAGPTPRASAIHVKFRPAVSVGEGTQAVARLWEDFRRGGADRSADDLRLLQSVSVKDWKTYRRTTIAPLEKEELAMVVMFVLVAVTAVFIVFVVFYMIVGHKSKDMGILKSVGASNAGIVGLFSGFAGLVGLLGGATGLLTGWLFLQRINRLEAWLFEHFGFQLWDRTLFAINDIPNRLQGGVVAAVAVSAVLVCLAGALVPTLTAARTSPVDSLRVNQL
jgi:lipoprotein-releasing system permease protein